MGRKGAGLSTPKRKASVYSLRNKSAAISQMVARDGGDAGLAAPSRNRLRARAVVWQWPDNLIWA